MSAPLFRLTGVAFAYSAENPVLNRLDFALSPGERVALIGSNGSGKTTLLHLLVGLLKPQRGEILAFGRARRNEGDFREVRARAGLLFQDPDDQLFCPTVAEDVAFGPLNLGKSRREALQIVRRTLESLGLAGFEQRVTHKLSGGEKRLVTLATVLAMDPEVLLLDEPTGGLDEAAEARLLRVLRSLPQAMVIVSHDRWCRDGLATRAAHLRDGRIVESRSARTGSAAP